MKGAREFLSQVQSIGGLEKIKELRVRKEQVDSVDRVYYGGDAEAKKQFLSNLQKQNPQAFMTAVTNGLALLTPEERSYIMGPHIAAQLREDNTWQWLEHIYNELQAELQGKPQLAGVSRLLNQFAGIFRKYGLGPSRQDTPEITQRRSEFHAEVAESARESLDRDIMAALNHFAPHVSSDQQLRDAAFTQVHLELQNAMRGDRHLKYAVTNLLFSGMSKSIGNRATSLIASKLRPYVPYFVQKFAAEFPSPKETKPAAANGKAASRNGARKEKLTQREVNTNQMDFISVLNDSREGEAR